MLSNLLNAKPELWRFKPKSMRRYERPQQVAQIIEIDFDANGKPTPTFVVFARPEDSNSPHDEARKLHPNILLPPLKDNGNAFI
jgi:hypothetical protein